MARSMTDAGVLGVMCVPCLVGGCGSVRRWWWVGEATVVGVAGHEQGPTDITSGRTHTNTPSSAHWQFGGGDARAALGGGEAAREEVGELRALVDAVLVE